MHFVSRLFKIVILLIITIEASCSATVSKNTMAYPLMTDTVPPDITQNVTPSLQIYTPEKTSSLDTKTGTEVPEIVKMCPLNQIVSPEELGVTAQNRLVVWAAGSLKLLDPKNGSFSSLPIQANEPVMSLPFWFQTSPDRKWIAYYINKSSMDLQDPFDLWVSSIDGNISWKVAEALPRFSKIHWDRTDLITVWLSDPDINVCSRPWLQIQPFTHTIEKFSPIYPKQGWPNCQVSLDSKWVSPDYSKYIFFDYGWKIFEYPSGNIQTAFPWLPQEGMGNLGTLDIKWTEQGVSILRPSPMSDHSFQFLLDIPFKTVFDQNISFREVNLKDFNLDFTRIREVILWWLDNGHQIAMNLHTEAEQSFSILDMPENILYDYCYDRGNASNQFFSSPDDRFLSWTRYQSSSGSIPQSIVILDKTTGKITEIGSEYEMVGWGLITEP